MLQEEYSKVLLKFGWKRSDLKLGVATFVIDLQEKNMILTLGDGGGHGIGKSNDRQMTKLKT